MKKSLLAVIVIIAIAVGLFLLTSTDDDTTSTSNNAPTATTAERQSVDQSSKTAETATTNQVEAGERRFTEGEVASRNTEDDCWTIIDGSVYDITSYIPRHPGGDDILLACGADGSSLFNSRTTAAGEEIGSGNPHSANAASQLSRLKLGTLATSTER